MDLRTLVIFDYSGTLSVEAVLFSHPPRLNEELEKAGLTELGVSSNAIFWEKVVAPTWCEAATSRIGYVKSMVERVISLCDGKAGDIRKEKVRDAVRRFVKSYMGSLTIHEGWYPLLQKLNEDERIFTIIATDHYAEATDAIVKHFRRASINCLPLEQWRENARCRFVVANSADIGFQKVDVRYWRACRELLPFGTLERILVIDDFRSHEFWQGVSGEVDKSYYERVLKCITEVFPVSIHVFFFNVGPGITGDNLSEVKSKIAEVTHSMTELLWRDNCSTLIL